MALGSRTRIGAVRLTVADLELARGFYERVVGLATLERTDQGAVLGSADGVVLVELDARPGAPPRPSGTTGLFHLAVLVPGREELGRSLRRIAAAGHPLTGASDHLVSESLYLRDPEGNGIEIYRDRPREEWPYEDGALQMATLPLDTDGVLAEGGGRDEPPPPEVPAGTTIGHVHLNVADLGATEAFYAELLGFDVTVRGYPGALFLSAGGYHHHLGANTWEGEGAPPPPQGSLGLAWFEVLLGDAAELDGLAQRLAAAAVETERADDGLRLADPAGNGILLRGPS